MGAVTRSVLNLAQVRHAYFHPPPDDPGRPLTREEVHARYERQRVERCLMRGGDPCREGLGEHGSLIGGAGKPLTLFGVRPERAVRLHPLPFAWFNHPRARATIPPRGGDERARRFLEMLAADHLAGMPERPGGRELRRLFRSTTLRPRERSQIWHIFACIRMCDLMRLHTRAGLSIYEIARSMRLAETRRAAVIRWINQFALPPQADA